MDKPATEKEAKEAKEPKKKPAKSESAKKKTAQPRPESKKVKAAEKPADGAKKKTRSKKTDVSQESSVSEIKEPSHPEAAPKIKKPISIETVRQPDIAVKSAPTPPPAPPPAVQIPKQAAAQAPVSIPETKFPEKPVEPLVRPSEARTATLTAPPKPKISINETITVKELAEKINVKVGELLMKLLKLGIRASLNQRLEIDTAILVSAEYGYEAQFVPIYSEAAMAGSETDDAATLVSRPPIVTIMGHVDHGKTSLLDAIRETTVAEKEAGGITQHIGAYKVHSTGGDIVFLDTPGHEAFTAMRARGAQVTDIVILVVAADDGVMPQTVEAIDHARAANVPIMVAVNKIDLPQAKAERVKQELSQYDLSPEEWGGKTIFVEVSAKKKTNIDKLLEMILLQAEVLELKANPDRLAQGAIVESRLDPKRGPVATVLVQKGTLKVGQTFVCGLTSGKVRALIDNHGQRLSEAGPATPVEVLGFSQPPALGDRVIVVASEREAREIVEKRKNLSREAVTEKARHISLEMLSVAAKQGQIKDLFLILKGDVQGSVEAVKDSIEKIQSQQIRVKVIHSGVGGINESDVSLAAASDAVIIGFNVRPEPSAEDLARQEGVEIKTYRIIYEAMADIRAAMEGLLEPEEKEVVAGRIEVRQIFKTPAGKVAGCMVVKGKVNRTCQIRVLRDSKIVYEGKISSLRRFKDDVREVEQGFECGLSLENFQDLNKGDILEAFTKEKRARKLE